MPPWVWKIPGIRHNDGIKASATLRAPEKTLDPTMGYVELGSSLSTVVAPRL
jgi:hypothetical protein